MCDLFSEELELNTMVSIDLYELNISVHQDNGMIYDMVPDLGRPRYSTDDTHIVFQKYNNIMADFSLFKLPLEQDKMTPAGRAEHFLDRSMLPVWFAQGESTIVETESVPVPIVLSQNFPNPFNQVTMINFTVPHSGDIILTVFDMLGQEIETLVNEYRPAGRYTVWFDGSDYASGTYFYRLRAGGHSKTKRMTLLK